MGFSAYAYADASTSSHGTMICTACSKPISTGPYRYRQKFKKHDWAYQAQHRACSASDRGWIKWDEQIAARPSRLPPLADWDFEEKGGDLIATLPGGTTFVGSPNGSPELRVIHQLLTVLWEVHERS